MNSALSHITFIVRDLERMSEILKVALGAREIYASGEKRFSIAAEKFFLVDDVWIAIMQGEALTERSYNHVAFKIDDEEIGARVAAIESLGLEFRNPRPRVDGEGRSVYFYDDDNHLFELHSGTLEARLARYRQAVNEGGAET